MRICLLTNQDLDADPFAEDDWPCDPRPFLPECDWEVATLEKATAARTVLALSGSNFDLFFNLCDGAWDEDRPGIEVVQTLERLNLPFTGATSEFYEPSRESMKRVCRAWGIDTPAYVMAACEADVERAAQALRFPLIVKHPSSYASIGLTRESRVETPEALLTCARRMIVAYSAALIEEFVEGSECTVLVSDNPDDLGRPTTYTPLQYSFPEGESFKHSDMKWVDYHEMRSHAVDDGELAALLREVSASFYLGLNGAGFGRCDLRVDREGRPFMLEINPNCGVYYPAEDAGSADLCLLHDPAGHEGFTRQIVRAALVRHQARQRPWSVRSRPDGEYGLFATRRIARHERIISLEEQPHELVSLSHMERHWGEPRASWFYRYAWPLTDEVWVIWGRDPETWMPINHSCDPSAWLDGLDVAARKPIGSGEEITLDYATFCNERMPSFACNCGAVECRGTIHGEDYLRRFVARYGDHTSDYVRRKRRYRVESPAAAGF